MIFSTQGRRPLIKPEFRRDLFAYLGGIIREMRGTALIINGTADHIHVLARIRPANSAAEIARVIKTNSSGWVRAKWSSDFAWQTGYGVFSVSESNVAAVTNYIASQDEHHKKHSFQEELLAFLKKNNVAYEEKYLWGWFLAPLRGLSVVASPPTAEAVGCILAPLRGWPRRHSPNTVRFRTIPHYERDLVRCRGQQVAFFNHGREVETGMVVHGIDPTAGDLRLGVCLPLLGKLFSY